MTKDIFETRKNYQQAYYGSVGVAMIELELIDMMTEHLGFDGMIYARELLDEKIPLWK